MKSSIITMIFICIITLNLEAQEQGPINVIGEKKWANYEQNGHYLNNYELELVLKTNPESAKILQRKKTNNIIGGTCAVASLVSISLMTVYMFKASNATVAGDFDLRDEYYNKEIGYLIIGLGLDIIAIPFLLLPANYLNKAVTIYNQTYKTGNTGNAILYLGVVDNGIGVKLRF